MHDRRPLVAAVVLAAVISLVLLLTGPGEHRGRPRMGGGTGLPAPAGRPQAPPPRGLIEPLSAPGPPASPPPAGPEVGANVNRLFNDRRLPASQIARSLRALAASGATAARSDALWEAAEPLPPTSGAHHYDWSFADTVAAQLAAQRLRWLPIIDYSAHWAQSMPGQDHSEPTSAGAYARYVAAFTARYGAAGSFWRTHPSLPAEPVRELEIWNEPDGGHFWLPGPDPRGYANLYAAARSAAKRRDPGVRVLVGGLTNPPLFMPALLRVRPDLRGHIDGVGIHPYAPDPSRMLALVRQDRLALRQLGLGGVPLYVTEFGWTIRPPGALDYLPGRLRPGHIRATLAALAHSDCGVAGVFLYTWQSPERDPRQGEDWFGIHPPHRASSPSQRAFAAGARAARTRQPALRVCG